MAAEDLTRAGRFESPNQFQPVGEGGVGHTRERRIAPETSARTPLTGQSRWPAKETIQYIVPVSWQWTFNAQ